jgi:choline dehydrogenase-like flavoprotein
LYDFVIVGSGPSGSVISRALVAAGARCVMLEAGKHFTSHTFPQDELGSNVELFWNGAIDLNTDASIALLRGKCVGGTSIVNQALLDRFDEVALGDWKADSGIPWFTVEEMAPHYEAVERHLSIRTIPEPLWNRNAEIFVEGHRRLGLGWGPMERGQTDCNTEAGNDCMVCLGGCQLDSKQSMLVTFLAEALAKGLELRPEFTVEGLEARGGEIRVRGRGKDGPVEVTGRRVVLAGGALGNSQILLRSGFGGKLPALGTRFACHPQNMHYGFFDEPVDAHRGAFQAVKSKDQGIRRRGFKLENVFAPPIATAMLVPGWGAEHQRTMGRYRHMACLEVCVRDEATGRIRLARNGRVRVEKRMTAQDEARLEDGTDLADRIFRTCGAREVLHSPFMFGVHLMGGCVIGTDPGRSVVNEGFALHTNPDVFIADSSAFPNAPGINPSLSVMALSHRAAERILKEAS